MSKEDLVFSPNFFLKRQNNAEFLVCDQLRQKARPAKRTGRSIIMASINNLMGKSLFFFPKFFFNSFVKNSF